MFSVSSQPAVVARAKNLSGGIGAYEDKMTLHCPALNNRLYYCSLLASLLSDMGVLDFGRIYTHPEYGKTMDLAFTVGMYAWHGNHHLAHIDLALEHKKIEWNQG